MNKNEIDLNLDAGESLEALLDGSEENLYRLVTSVSIACGGHTGNKKTMHLAVSLAKKYGLNIGAHPSFSDKENFGRTILKLPPDQLYEELLKQITDLENVCEEHNVKMTHLKPHGALYNLAANDLATCNVLIKLAGAFPNIKVMTLANSKSVKWLRSAQIEVLTEGFVDRRYEPDGTLRPRKFADALISDPVEASHQALRVAMVVDTLCIHGDSQDALFIAKKVREELESKDIKVKAFPI